ncbi:hypothetical protein [Vibrio sp. AND4]|uniref:tetratricopeptide repeat protein n=1 Tax=Vibrio sp. AND4 TaxID=314289 RepID=UPI00015F359C|nr:hypothetical protein [Vibrio sp. AND4]EDP59610.1 hypothetical protein AND4_10649 [Vibrio sp. AND4]
MKKNFFCSIVLLTLFGCQSTGSNYESVELAFNLKSYDKVITQLSDKKKISDRENFLLAYSFYKNGNGDRAIYVLSTKEKLNYDDLYLLAVIYLEDGDNEKSRNYLDKIKKTPEYQVNNKLLAKVDNLYLVSQCEDLGKKKCSEEFVTLSRKYPTSESIYNNMLLSRFAYKPDDKSNFLKIYNSYETGTNDIEYVVLAGVVAGQDEMVIDLLNKKYKDKAKALLIYEDIKYTTLK